MRCVRIHIIMDITLVSPDTLKVKTKSSIFTVEIGNGFSISFEGSSVVFSSPGEYEVKGIKLTGLGKTQILGFAGKIDGMDVCITKASFVKQLKDQFGEYNILILNEDELIDQAAFAASNAQVAVIFGEKAAEHIKVLGKEISPVSKFSITKDKLPGELEVILLQK